MSRDAVARLAAAVAGTPLETRLEQAAQPLREPGGAAAALDRLDGPMLRGVARAVAGQTATATFLCHHPKFAEGLASTGPDPLGQHVRELAIWRLPEDADLETALDLLRVRRREETCFAACVDFAGLARFEQVSGFLSILAETITRHALDLARRTSLDFSVIGMGKIAGREFTYHSDLDLLFLYEGGTEEVDEASRVGQRLISYLTTMTGAGVAYDVDTRLRPSGGQGMLVASLAGFERYQCEQAQTWEHLAMLRARPIAGDVAVAQAALDRVRTRVLAERKPPWADLVAIRRRVEEERTEASATRLPLKTGAGCLMDVDFLAGGGLLERAPERLPALPSVPALLSAVSHGPATDALLEDYALLRRVEATARWMAGRAVEAVDASGDALDVVAELCQPAWRGELLRDRLDGARRRIRAAYRRVVDSGSIAALEDAGDTRSHA